MLAASEGVRGCAPPQHTSRRTLPRGRRGWLTPRGSPPRPGSSEDGTSTWTESVRRPAPVRPPTCSPSERGMWLTHRPAHHAVLLGSIPARRLHPLGEEGRLAAEGFHPGHSPTLAHRTHRPRLVRRWRRLGGRRHWPCGASRLLKQYAAQPELRLAAPVREQPIMAETLEAGGQDMKQEPSNELDGIKRHQALAIPMGIVFPSKGHPSILQGHQTTIGDRHAMGIAREIL